ncbi:MAG: hypothetical protein ACE5EN_06235, partial [Nitrospinota bacterium]
MIGSKIAYSLIQALHNVFGALTLAFAIILFLHRAEREKTRRLLWILLFIWGAQGATGSSFAAASYYFYGAAPDISKAALAAMYFKILCVALAFSYCAWLLYKRAVKLSLASHLLF